MLRLLELGFRAVSMFSNGGQPTAAWSKGREASEMQGESLKGQGEHAGAFGQNLWGSLWGSLQAGK